MKITEYKLYKTAQKTAKENNLSLVNGNMMTKQKLLFDFSFLETLDIPNNEKEAIKKQAMESCSVVNRTAFVFYNADDWTMCHAVVDFNFHRVYNVKTCKTLYIILEVKRVEYCHAERMNKYDSHYTENIREFEVDSKTESAMNDLEV